MQAYEVEGKADLAGLANLAIQPVVGAVGLITYAHEDGIHDIELMYIDGATVEVVAEDVAGNFSVPGGVPVCNTRYCQATNTHGGVRFMSYVGVLFT